MPSSDFKRCRLRGVITPAAPGPREETHMKLTKRLFLAMAASSILATLPVSAFAQDWGPRRPIDFTIMAGPGGGADQIARFIQSVVQAGEMTNRPLIPTNRGGGSGAESLLHLKDARDPDHTLMVTLNSFYTTPIRQEALGVDIETFTPIFMMGVDPFILWVHRDSGITTFEEWVEKVKEMNGEYVMSGTGTGQEDSIVIAYLAGVFDLDIKYIPFDGGGAVAASLAGQQVMATVNNPSEAKGFYEAGDLVPLLSFSDERMDAYPDVPTLKEKGTDFSYFNQRAIVGAPGMSPEAAAYYRDLFGKVYEAEQWQSYLVSESMSPLPMNEAENRAYWATQVATHRQLLAEIGF